MRTKPTHQGSLRAKLDAIESDLSSERDTLQACEQTLREAQADLAKVDASPAEVSGTPQFRHAQQIRDERDAARERVEALQEAQVELLRQVGRHQGRVRSGINGPVLGGDDWDALAGGIDLSAGVDRVDAPLTSLLRGSPMAAGGLTTTGTPVAPVQLQSVAGQPLDSRGLFAYLPGEQMDGVTPSISDYKVTSRSVEGEITRAPTATTEKAQVALGLKLASDDLEQFAVFLPGVPRKLLDYVPSLAEVLQTEMRKLLIARLNLHIIEQIVAAEPPEGETSKAVLLERLRAAVKEARAAGVTPQIVALSPTQGEALDLSTSGVDKAFVFNPRLTGAAGGDVWGLTPVEVPGLESEPVVIDPTVLAKVFYGNAQLRVDEQTELDKNLIRLELSFEALCNIRQPTGAYIASEEEAEGE
jgi:hypothetical protein